MKNLDVPGFKKALEAYDFKTLPKRLDGIFKKSGKIVPRSEIPLRGKKIEKTQMKLI